MKTPAPVAVIIPVFNREKIIVKTLESVAAQTVLPRALIVVDDGSTDGTAGVVKKWMETQKDRMTVQYVYQENRGVSAARNHGLRIAPPTEFVAFLDSDDVWPVDLVERAVSALEKNPDAAAAVTNLYWPPNWRKPRQTLRRFAGRLADHSGVEGLLQRFLPDNARYMPADPVLWIIRYGGGLNSCTMCRRSYVEQVGGFDESLRTGEDVVLYLNLTLRGSWVYLPGWPVRRGTRQTGGEGSLTKKYPDNHRRWARAYDSFFSTHDVSGLISEPKLHTALARRWRCAALELASAGDHTGADECRKRQSAHIAKSRSL